jgi:DNA-binding MarR family transcriptional regulator
MYREIEKIINFEKNTNVRCVYNELKIVFQLSLCGPLGSMEILKKTGASISGHNADIKRLCALNIIEILDISSDKRKRLYFITNKSKKFMDFN